MNNANTVITGLGCISAAGNSVDESFKTIYEGKRNPKPSTIISADLDKQYPVFEIEQDLDAVFSEKTDFKFESKNLTRTNKLLLIALSEALKNAGLNLNQKNDLKIGVAVGTTVGCTLNNEQFYRDYKSNIYPDITAFKKFLNSSPALFISEIFNLKGPAICIANACSSGTDAVGLAKTWIDSGICDIVICGGADELCRITYLGFISLLVASPDPCKPFDKKRKGLNLGEGAGILILENINSAKNRNAEILAEVLGYGCRADAYHPTGPHPDGKGLRGAIYKALGQAKLKPQDLGFINAHGTATPDNDKIEGKVFRDIFEKNLPVCSTKCYTGHTLGAAGGIEAGFTVRALMDKKVPATIGFEKQDSEIKMSPTTANTDIISSIGLSTSLAFGGTNSALIFGR